MKKITRFAFVIAMALIATFPLTAWGAYPERTVTILCGPAAGGGTDRILRGLATELQKVYGQPFVIENRPGASHAISHAAVAKAKPDGYTLVGSLVELSQYHWMGIDSVNYKDFAHIALINLDPACVTVRADAPWQTLKELLDYAKEHPGEVSMASSPASIWNLARLALTDTAGMKPDDIFLVPTTGAAGAIPELLGGHIQVVFNGYGEVKAQVEAGQFKVLAIMADERSPAIPDVPTAKEEGYDISYFTFRGLSAPKDTPREIVDGLTATVKQICESDSFKDFMDKNGFLIHFLDGKDYEALLKKTDENCEHILKLGGLIQPAK